MLSLRDSVSPVMIHVHFKSNGVSTLLGCLMVCGVVNHISDDTAIFFLFKLLLAGADKISRNSKNKILFLDLVPSKISLSVVVYFWVFFLLAHFFFAKIFNVELEYHARDLEIRKNNHSHRDRNTRIHRHTEQQHNIVINWRSVGAQGLVRGGGKGHKNGNWATCI